MKILTIGGGTAQRHMLLALKLLRKRLLSKGSELAIVAVPATTDSGGSTLGLRAQYDIVAPGDISQCFYGLHPDPEGWKEFFTRRYQEGELAGHSERNLIVARYLSNDLWKGRQEGLDQLCADYQLEGRIVPVTFTSSDLQVETGSGVTLVAQNTINQSNLLERGGVVDLKLLPAAEPNPAVLEEIKDADVIIIGPGNLRSSIEACLAVKNIPTALQRARALKVYGANLVQQPGHMPPTWSVSDYVDYLEKFYLGDDFFEVIVCNTESLPISLTEGGVVPVLLGDQRRLKGRLLVHMPLLMTALPERHEADVAGPLRSPVLHDPTKVARALELMLVEMALL